MYISSKYEIHKNGKKLFRYKSVAYHISYSIHYSWSCSRIEWKYFEVTGSIVKLSESSKNIILAQKKKKNIVLWSENLKI